MTLMLVFTAISNAAAAQKFLILMCLPATKKGLTDFQLRTEMFITVAYVQAVIIKIINFKGETIMAKKYYCPVCGYESDEPIEICPICKAKMAVREDNAEMSWAAEHVVGVGKSFGADVPEEVQKEIIDGLNDHRDVEEDEDQNGNGTVNVLHTLMTSSPSPSPKRFITATQMKIRIITPSRFL